MGTDSIESPDSQYCGMLDVHAFTGMDKETRHNILVVIPTLNEAAHITQVLADLTIDPPMDCDVLYVVADGGSHDGTCALVEEFAAGRSDVRLLHNPERLQSAAVNLAVEHYGDERDLLVRCDAHAAYPRGFVRMLVGSAMMHRADAVVVPMDSVGTTCFQRAVGWVSDSKAGSGGSAHRGGRRSAFVDHGHHAMFRMDSFRRAGGYEPSFSHNEDAELDCRQRALGSRIFLDARIRLQYGPRSTAKALARQYFNYGKGRSRTVRRHPSSVRARQLAIPVHVVLMIASLLLAGLDGRFLSWPILYVTVLACVAIDIAIRRRSLCGLLSAPAAAIAHFGWGLGFIWGLISIRERRWDIAAAQVGRSPDRGPIVGRTGINR